jgi:hypothetical protein
MPALIIQLREKYNSDMAISAALGITRQAFSQAARRGRLSESAAIAAAALLEIDPGAALLANATAPRHIAAPVLDAAPELPSQPAPKRANNTNYARFADFKKTANAVRIRPHVHVITSQKQEEALDLIRWVYAVARLPADSPRFNWYVSRWAIPDKIAAAKKAGTFADLVANCPPIDPAWIRLVPAALQACKDFHEQTTRPTEKARASSEEMPIESNRHKKAA